MICCVRRRPMPRLQAIAGFFGQMQGAETPFWLAPPGLASVTGQALGTGDGATSDISRCNDPTEVTPSPSKEHPAFRRSISTARRFRARNGRSRRAICPPSRLRRRPARASPSPLISALLWLCRFAEDVARFRGVHGDAVRTAGCEADDSAAMTTPPVFPVPPRPRLERP